MGWVSLFELTADEGLALDLQLLPQPSQENIYLLRPERRWYSVRMDYSKQVVPTLTFIELKGGRCGQWVTSELLNSGATCNS